MLCINNKYTDAYFNLAAEEYLLHSFSEDIFMLWQNEPSVIIGKNQHAESEINEEFVETNKIKVVRRFSGGGAVYHDLGNLNFTFIEKSGKSDFSKQTRQMQSLLKTVGINAVADQRHTLSIDGMKISGSAQCIHKGRAMYHATLLYDSNLDNLKTALQSKSEPLMDKKYVQSVRSPITNIREHMSDSMTIDEFKTVIKDFILADNTPSSICTLSEPDRQAINKLVSEKYATKDWNFYKKQN